MSVRGALAAIPFVSENEDGALDLWAVRSTQCPRQDVDRGRQYAAWLLHIARGFDAPFLVSHVVTAWRASSRFEETRDVARGVFFELSDTIRAGSRNHPALLVASGRKFDPGDLRAAALGLPFVREREDGGLDYAAMRATGDPAEDMARGRFYGALTGRFIQDTGHPSILAFIAQDAPFRAEQSALLVGFLGVLTEVAEGTPCTVTTHQTAALPLYRESRAHTVSRAT